MCIAESFVLYKASILSCNLNSLLSLMEDLSPPQNDSDPENQIPTLKQTENGQLEKPFKAISNKKKKSSQDSAFTNGNSSPPTSSSSVRSSRMPYKRRHRKVVLAVSARRNLYLHHGEVEAIALPLGMSVAAVVAQVLEKNNATGEKLSADYLSMICTSAVRESLANVFGEKIDSFSRSFEKSFGSTLRTLRLISASSLKDTYSLYCLNCDTSASDLSISKNVGETSCSMENSLSQREFSSFSIQDRVNEEGEGEVRAADYLGQELDSCGKIGQLIPAQWSLTSVSSSLSALKKSVFEQIRSNNLEEVKIALKMRRMQLEEAQLRASLDSNDLERSKLALGVSKLKTELQETRHTELLNKVLDCLVAGLFIMSALLSCGAYVFSYQRIIEATASCNKGSESRWIPNPMASFNSGWDYLKCQVQVASRMMFGLLMILAVSYLLLQRSGGRSLQAMPVTFILLMLGVACGFVGTICVNTLGGNGMHWLLYWEIMCLLHFMSIVCTPTLFGMLHGPDTASPDDGTKSSKVVPFPPYWLRRFLYYALLLAFMPLCCGLLPFAGPGEWKKQFGLFAWRSFIN